MEIESIDRWRGALLGLACGDALGMPFEFADPMPVEPVTEMLPHERLRFPRAIPDEQPLLLPAGSWTDDTSTTLCLAESLLECGDVDLRDQMYRYWRWGRQDYLSATGVTFGMGPTVRIALAKFEAGEESWGDPSAQTNGSLMRAAAVPLYFGSDRRLLDAAAECSDPTHRDPVCRAACQIYASLMVAALRGAERKNLLAAGSGGAGLERPLPGRLESVLDGNLAQRDRSQISGDNDVQCTLEAALWSFATTRDFESGAAAAISLGLDTDTTACVYGALAGAHYGVGAIPDRWLEAVQQRDLLEGFAQRLHAAAN
jgi:ADP-ribosyl-[dinitrogen reductase] hydrolase